MDLTDGMIHGTILGIIQVGTILGTAEAGDGIALGTGHIIQAGIMDGIDLGTVEAGMVDTTITIMDIMEDITARPEDRIIIRPAVHHADLQGTPAVLQPVILQETEVVRFVTPVRAETAEEYLLLQEGILQQQDKVQPEQYAQGKMEV